MAEARGAVAYDDPERMLDEQRPDVVYVAVPPSASVAICLAVVARGIPFLVEKPLAATDATGPARVAAAITDRGLVVAVGYHLRSLETLPEVRARLAANPARLVTARWNDGTPAPAWWRREVDGGGQVIEQATHLYDLARLLVGEAEVVGAASLHETPRTPAKRTSPTRARRSCASPPVPWGPSPTRAARRRRSSTSRSRRTARSRRSERAARTRWTGRSSCATAAT